MLSPDQSLFEEDVASAAFRIGEEKRFWALAEPAIVPADLAWPKRILCIAAAKRPDAPDRFYLLLDLEGYRSVPPTGAFWDPAKKLPLPTEKWPKGQAGSRFAKVFRTDWKNAIAFYHPYDRVASQSHRKWLDQQPHLIWTSDRTIVDYLEEFHSLLQSGDYIGV